MWMFPKIVGNPQNIHAMFMLFSDVPLESSQLYPGSPMEPRHIHPSSHWADLFQPHGGQQQARPKAEIFAWGRDWKQLRYGRYVLRNMWALQTKL